MDKFHRGNYALFYTSLLPYELCKNANFGGGNGLKFILTEIGLATNRSFAFFGALTSVGALF
jgi:hypothetical protein